MIYSNFNKNKFMKITFNIKNDLRLKMKLKSNNTKIKFKMKF